MEINMDLKSFSTKELRNKGVDMPIYNPTVFAQYEGNLKKLKAYDEKPFHKGDKDFYLTIVSAESKQYQDYKRKLELKQQRENEDKIDSGIDESDIAKGLVLDGYIHFDGKDLTGVKLKNKLDAIFDECPYIRNQIFVFAGKYENFIQPSNG